MNTTSSMRSPVRRSGAALRHHAELGTQLFKKGAHQVSRYVLPDLRYDYGALEPHLSGKIMQLHHDKHHRTYVDTANECIEKLNDLPGEVRLQGAVVVPK